MGLDTGGDLALRLARGRAVNRRLVLIGWIGLALSAGCEPGATTRRDDDVPSPAVSSRDTSPSLPDRAAPDTSAWTAGIVDRPLPSAPVVTLVAVRAARHDGFDRVAFEFAEPTLPGLHVEYVDRPVRDCGAGHVVPIAGDGWLAIRLHPANAHDEGGRPTAGPRELVAGLPIVLEIERTCDFEAVVEYVLGVSSPNRYRVLELSDPARIVVDVRHRR